MALVGSNDVPYWPFRFCSSLHVTLALYKLFLFTNLLIGTNRLQCDTKEHPYPRGEAPPTCCCRLKPAPPGDWWVRK